ncbi:MAG: metallophosphoesterase [Phyllobacterium sp.]
MLCGLDPLQRLQACIADINWNHTDAALVIFTGDLSDARHEITYRALLALIPPYRLMLGNHDDRERFAAGFDQMQLEKGFVQRRRYGGRQAGSAGYTVAGQAGGMP